MKNLIITGMPRSATTFVSKIIYESGKFLKLEEPLAHKIPVEDHYPFYLTKNSRGRSYFEIFNDLFNYKLFFNYKPRKNGFRNKLLLGFGKSIFQYIKLYLAKEIFNSKKKILVKEPHGSFMLPYFESLKNTKILILIRYPAAFVNSMHSLEWKKYKDTPESLLEQKILIEDYLNWLPELLNKRNFNDKEKTALLWRCVYQFIDEYIGERNAGDIMVIRHEDISLKPAKYFKKIYSWMGMNLNHEIERKIESLTSSSNTTRRTKKVAHQYKLKRNSKEVINYWKENLTEKEIKQIKKITKPVVDKYYPDADELFRL